MNFGNQQKDVYQGSVPALRSELQDRMPLGGVYAPMETLVQAMAEEIVRLNRRVDTLLSKVEALRNSR